jgi:flagellar biosynthetic protein FlhB
LAVTLYAGSALAALAVIDYVLQRRRLWARMRMTRAEVMREQKQEEGDPQIKRRRKKRMQEISRRRLESAVKGANVVIINPTEYAVALRYRSQHEQAPRVVAKGRGALAERIRKLARRAGIPIMAEPPLCRLIYRLVPEGREIPAQLYRAVAEVLAYVYRIQRRTA